MNNEEEWPTPQKGDSPIKPVISQHTKDLIDLEMEVETLKNKITDAIGDLHEIAKVGRNPAAPMAKKLIAKLESS